MGWLPRRQAAAERKGGRRVSRSHCAPRDLESSLGKTPGVHRPCLSPRGRGATRPGAAGTTDKREGGKAKFFIQGANEYCEGDCKLRAPFFLSIDFLRDGVGVDEPGAGMNPVSHASG